MGVEFIPALIQTNVWESFTWEGLRSEMAEDIRELAKKKDMDGLLRLVQKELKYTIEELKPEINCFAEDITGACGVVAVRQKIYQDIILAFLDYSRQIPLFWGVECRRKCKLF